MVLSLAVVLFSNGTGRAKAGQRVEIDSSKLKQAIINIGTSNGKITSVTVSSTGYSGSDAYLLNAEGTAVATFQNGVFTIRPKTTGDTVALTGDCSMLFSSYDYGLNHSCTALDDLRTVDLSGLETSHVSNFTGLFQAGRIGGPDSKLESVNMTGCDLSSVQLMSGFCDSCVALTSITVEWDTLTNVTVLSNLFYRCSSLTSVDFLADLDTSKVTTIAAMLGECSKLTSIPYASWTLTSLTSADYCFSGTAITSFSFANFHVSYPKLMNMRGLFAYCKNLTDVDMSAITYVADNPDLKRKIDSLFEGCSALTTLKMGKINLPGTACSMTNLFFGCSSLEHLDLSDFQPGYATSYRNVFNGCKKLRSIDVSKFTYPGVTDLLGMFYDCESLQAIDLSKMGSRRVTNMSEMFAGCTSLTYLNLSNFVCDYLLDATAMFARCENLKHVDLGGFYKYKPGTGSEGYCSFTAKDMFDGCTELVSINLRNLHYGASPDKVTSIFGDTDLGTFCAKLKYICSEHSAANTFFGMAYGSSPAAYGITTNHKFVNGKCEGCGTCQSVVTNGSHSYQNHKCSSCGICEYVAANGVHNFVNGVCPCGESSSGQLNIPMQCSLVLNSNIQVVLLFDIPSDLASDPNAYIRVTLPSENQDFPISQTGTVYIEQEPWRQISYTLPAKCMADKATVTIYNGSGNVKFTEDEISVKKYAEIILGNSAYNQKTKNLVKAMLNYGAYAQNYFLYNTGELANEGNEMTLPSNADTLEAVSGFAVTVDNNAPGVNHEGCSLLLQDEITVRFWYTFSDTLSQAQKNAYISSMGLSANGAKYYHDGTPYAVGGWGYPVISGNSDITVTYSPMAYVSDVLKFRSGKTSLVNLAKAMYVYWNAAMAYIQ